MIKISIITVSYNTKGTIERTIQSVVNQNYDNIEYIIIDGGSTDGTIDIIKKYDTLISFWISEHDNGIYDAMNKGLLYATGEYVYFLNADDYLCDDIISVVASFMKKEKADVYYGNVIKKYVNKYELFVPKTLSCFYWEMPLSHQGVFIRFDERIKYDDSCQSAADYKLLLSLYDSGAVFFYMPVDIAYYSMSGISYRNRFASICEVTRIALEVLNDNSRCTSLYIEKVIRNYVDSVADNEVKNNIINGYLATLLYDTIDLSSKLVIFGCGVISKKWINFLTSLGYTIDLIVDNNKSRIGEKIDGINIDDPIKLKKMQDTTLLVLIESGYLDVVYQIRNLRLNKSVKVYTFTDLMKLFFEQYSDILLREIV